MSQASAGKVVSLLAGGSLTAHRVVGVSAANTVTFWATQTSNILGVTLDFADSGAAAAIVLDGTAKCVCFASVSVGAIVGPATDGSGKIQERANGATQTAKTLGIALESGSTDGTIMVALMVDNKAQA